jgi:hypothetical protein
MEREKKHGYPKTSLRNQVPPPINIQVNPKFK